MAIEYDDDFLDVAQDTFGITRHDAELLYDDMAVELDASYLDLDDLYNYGDMASDLVEEMEDTEFEVEYEPDIDYGDDGDEMLDVGDEVEVTATVAYE